MASNIWSVNSITDAYKQPVKGHFGHHILFTSFFSDLEKKRNRMEEQHKYITEKWDIKHFLFLKLSILSRVHGNISLSVIHRIINIISHSRQWELLT